MISRMEGLIFRQDVWHNKTQYVPHIREQATKTSARRTQIRHSIVASIPACHAGDRGSIPRVGVLLHFVFFQVLLNYCFLRLPLGGHIAPAYDSLDGDHYHYYYQE
jgi:hypothetical protein